MQRLKRVVLIGGESTGKTTLSQKLAAHFKGVFVPEYARGYLDNRDFEKDPFCEDDFEIIARKQWDSVVSASMPKNFNPKYPLVICDTEAVTTMIWSQVLIQKIPPTVEQVARQQQYDLYLLTHYEDVPYEPEPNMRFLEREEERKKFHNDLLAQLTQLGINHVQIRGASLEARLKSCINEIEELF